MSNKQYKQVCSGKELDELLSILKNRDNDTFIKEFHYSTITSIEQTGIVAPDSLGDLDILILSSDEDFSEMRLWFIGVSVFNIVMNYDFAPIGTFNENNQSIEIDLFNGMGMIKAEKLFFYFVPLPVSAQAT